MKAKGQAGVTPLPSYKPEVQRTAGLCKPGKPRIAEAPSSWEKARERVPVRASRGTNQVHAPVLDFWTPEQ